MHALPRTCLALGLVVLTTVGSAAPASAITGGQPDGNRHPSVGLILTYDQGGRSRCSATLIAPTVLITAAHCAVGTVGSTLVTFDSAISSEPPAPFPVAADPAVGFTPEEITAADYRSGTAIAHPGFSPFADYSDWLDVGVIVLDDPIADVPLAKLAPLDYLDEFAQPRLNSTYFTLVGYGTEVRKPESGPQKPQPMDFPLLRRYTTAPGQKLMPRILQLNGNPQDTKGGGGSCFGDSGGPAIHEDYLVAVSSFVLTDNCRYLSAYQRVDVETVQEWVASMAPAGR